MSASSRFATRLSNEDRRRIKDKYPLVDVLARVGIDSPDNWDGVREFRVPAGALEMPFGSDDSQGVSIRPAEGTWTAWHGYDNAAADEKHLYRGDALALVCSVAGITSPYKAAQLLESGAPIPIATRSGSANGASGPRARVQARSSYSEDPDLARTPLHRVQAINNEAWRYYTLDKLAERARSYLKARNIDVTAVEAEAGQPLAGHTPKSATGLVEHLRKKGYGDDELVDSGWARRKRGETELTDKYRDRALLPFRDEQGNVVGVTGRSVTWKKGDTSPKYLNHPQTVAFDKSAVLYRPHVPAALDTHVTVIACEGTLDALAIAAAAAQAGHSDKYAPCSQSGLSLTDAVAPRFFGISTRPPLVCADGDATGQKATEKWAREAMQRHHREVLALALPDGMDPAEWLAQEGSEGLIAFTRKGCLDDNENLRPKPAGGLLADRYLTAALEAAQRTDPDAESVTVVGPVIDKLAQLGAEVPIPEAIRRFSYEAGKALAARVDGMSALSRAAQIEAAVTTQINLTSGYDPTAGPAVERQSVAV